MPQGTFVFFKKIKIINCLGKLVNRLPVRILIGFLVVYLSNSEVEAKTILSIAVFPLNI